MLNARRFSDLLAILAEYEVRDGGIYIGRVRVAVFVSDDPAIQKNLAKLLNIARLVTKE